MYRKPPKTICSGLLRAQAAFRWLMLLKSAAEEQSSKWNLLINPTLSRLLDCSVLWREMYPLDTDILEDTIFRHCPVDHTYVSTSSLGSGQDAGASERLTSRLYASKLQLTLCRMVCLPLLRERNCFHCFSWGIKWAACTILGLTWNGLDAYHRLRILTKAN